MTEITKKMEEHLDGFPIREKELQEFKRDTMKRFDDISSQIKVGLTHPESAPQTIARLGSIEDDMKEVKALNAAWTVDNSKKMERIERVLFGDPLDDKDLGLSQMVKDIHSRATGKDGFWQQFFFIGKIATTGTVLVLAFAGIYHFLKK